ncbi:MAG: Flp pilus assembly protein CpaB [Vicinamibacterales bacterium]
MTRGARNVLVLVTAVGMAGVASFAVYRAVQNIPVREVEVAHSYAVVAVKPLAVGTLIAKDHVAVVPWPAKNPVPGAFSKPEDVVGRGLVASVLPNEPITESKLAPREAGAGLAPTILPGMRAISVKVNEVIAVAGYVVPGSRVDVLVSAGSRGGSETMARTVVQNVQVLSAGTRIDQEKARTGEPIPAAVVTLMVTPEDAERITLAQNEGRLMLALRNPLDTLPVETTGVRMAALTGPPAPPPVKAAVAGRTVMKAVPKPVPPAPPPPYTVEAIRGAKRSEEVIK